MCTYSRPRRVAPSANGRRLALLGHGPRGLSFSRSMICPPFRNLLLVPIARNVIAFRSSAAASVSAAPATGWPVIAGIVLACLTAAGALSWASRLIRRQRRT